MWTWVISYFSYSDSLIIAVLMLSTDQCTPYGNLFSCVLILATSWNLNSIHFFLPFSLPINVFSAYMQAHVWVVFICLQCVGSFTVLHVAIVSLVHVCTYKVTISCCGSGRPVYFDTLMVWSTLLRTRELTILGVIFSRPPHNLPNLNLNTWN